MARRRIPSWLLLVAFPAAALLMILATLMAAPAKSAGPAPAPLVQADVATCNFAGGGGCVIEHDLGATPDSVNVMINLNPGSADLRSSTFRAGSLTASSFTVYQIDTETGLYDHSGTQTLFWQAFADGPAEPEPTPSPSPSPSDEPSPTPTPSPSPSDEPSEIACTGPVTGARTISSGGTHAVNVDNDTTNPGVIVNTTDPVTITGCIDSDGRGVQAAPGSRVTIDRTRIRWTRTSGSPGVHEGRAVFSQNAAELAVTNSEILQSEGIIVVEDGRNGTPVTITDNYVESVRQVVRAGPFAQFLQLYHVNSGDVEVARNVVRNEPCEANCSTTDTMSEDIISLYRSRGADAASPIHVHHNDIDGSYPRPADGPHSGCGIITDASDQAGGSNSDVQHVLIEHNEVRNTTNCGIGIAAASNNVVVRDNCVVQLQADAQDAANVGIYTWDQAEVSGGWGGVELRDNHVNWHVDDFQILSPVDVNQGNTTGGSC